MNLLLRFQRVRESEGFQSLEPTDRSFIGYCLEYCDGYFDPAHPEKASVGHLFGFDELQRFRRIEEVLIG